MADMLRSLATQKPTGAINLVLSLQMVNDFISVNEDDLAKLEKFRNDFGQDGWDSEFEMPKNSLMIMYIVYLSKLIKQFCDINSP